MSDRQEQAIRLDLEGERLWCGAEARRLRPKSFAVLRHLVAQAGRVVSKEELLEAVWPGTTVSDGVLKVCLSELRQALGDTARGPQYIETVPRRGYRWIGPFSMADPPRRAAAPGLPATGRGPLLAVGREAEGTQLHAWLAQARHRTRQVGFLTGAAGTGKTTVVDVFLAQVAHEPGLWLARGQCVDHYGVGKPYLPVLEALGQLGRGSEGPAFLAVLRRYAPMWLAQFPGLVSEAELERVQRQVQGATPARMLRELAEALEVLTADILLVFVLEDLHWSDPATLECLAAPAQRREPARLLVVGTYRPVELGNRGLRLRGLVQELIERGYGVELPLALLPAEDVAAYMARRLEGPVASPLAAFVHERTEGHALFMASLVEHLIQEGLVAWQGAQWRLLPGMPAVESVPKRVWQFIVRRIEALPRATQRVLEAASVVGPTFTAAAVAAGAQCAVADVEAVCDELVRQQHFLDDSGLAAWPDGTSGGSYKFRHVLYQQVLYDRLGATRRMQLHRRIGGRMEAAYGARVGEVAAPLASHFERGGEPQHAVHYLPQVGAQAARRNAPDEAVAIFRKGLELLATVPDSPERAQHELTLQLALGEMLITLQGRTAPAVRQAYTRAHALCQQLFALVSCSPDPAFMLEGHLAVGGMALHRGDLITGRTHLEHSLHFCASPRSAPPTFHGGFVSGVFSRTWLAQALEALGYADQARQRSQEALSLARQAGHTLSLVYAELYAALHSQLRRDVAATRTHADVAVTLAAAQDSALRVAQGRMLQGWALAMRGDAAAGVAHIHQGLAALHGVGPELLRPYWLSLLSEAYSQARQPESGLQVVAEALRRVAATEEHWWEAELYRLQGELLLQLPRPEVCQAETCLQHALEVARRQQAKALELRAALSLSRLWQQQGQRKAAQDLLAPIYTWFTEGFDTPDLQEAKTLLAAVREGIK